MRELNEFTAPGMDKKEKETLHDVASTSRECAEFITEHCKPSFGMSHQQTSVDVLGPLTPTYR